MACLSLYYHASLHLSSDDEDSAPPWMDEKRLKYKKMLFHARPQRVKYLCEQNRSADCQFDDLLPCVLNLGIVDEV